MQATQPLEEKSSAVHPSISYLLYVHNLTPTQAVLPVGPRAEGGGHLGEALPSGLTRTGPRTAEPWCELCQTLRVKTAGLGQL